MANDKSKYDLLQQTITISNGDDYSIMKESSNSNLVEIVGRYNPMNRLYTYFRDNKNSFTSMGVFSNCTTTQMPVIGEVNIVLPVSLKVKYATLTMGSNHDKWCVGDRSTIKLPNLNYHGNIILLDEDWGNASTKYSTTIKAIVGTSRQFAMALIDEVENKSVDPSKYGTYINYHVIGEL